MEDELSKGILIWYDWKINTTCLVIADTSNAISHMLSTKGIKVTVLSSAECCSNELQQLNESFDYIVILNQLEYCKEPKKLLINVSKFLKCEGTLFLGIDNRLGLRYFLGDRDPFTNKVFDGLENYRKYGMSDMENFSGRNYTKAEAKAFLKSVGFEKIKTYAVMADIRMPQLIYAEGYTPNEDLSIRYFPLYHHPTSIFLKEEYLLADLIDNEMFHSMANGFLFECNNIGNFLNVNHVTLSLDRGSEKAMATVIKADGVVEKCAIYKEGIAQLKVLESNMRELKKRGVHVVEAHLANEKYIMPYIEADNALVYLRRLLLNNKEAFIEKMDYFRNIILKSSEHVSENENGVILRYGYIDMVPLNCFYENEEFIFYDQEYCIENYPANAIIFRALIITYNGDAQMEQLLPLWFFIERYGLVKKIHLWQKLTSDFIRDLREQEAWKTFMVKYQRIDQIVERNRGGMNETIYYDEMIENCFLDIGTKKVYIFGTGRFADKFWAMYGKDYQIEGVIDNANEKWGMEWHNLIIQSPHILKEIDVESFKVIVCIKDYPQVVNQLLILGIKFIGIYDAHYIYPGRQAILPESIGEIVHSKKYHIGYVAGVFDLYHIGHLNILKRAKEQCDYLIVGVVSDEGVRNNKKCEPFIPFEERIEIIRSCKYVDEAVEIPYVYCHTTEAFEKYHFDVQFSGSDYENDPGWLNMKKYLELHGSTMVFLPYTEQTSSSKIKSLIESRLV